MHTHLPSFRRLALLACAALLAGGCGDDSALVLRTTRDRAHTEELVRRFELESGLRVDAEYAVGAGELEKGVRGERERPRCDVVWTGEVALTADLAEEGLLESYDSPSAAAIPAAFRDPAHRWTCFAARLRVCVVNSVLVKPAEIHSVRDLLDPKWKGKVCMALPLSGSSLSHAAALFLALGETETRDFYRALQSTGVHFVRSDEDVVRLVREGEMFWGVAASDECESARAAGARIEAVYPDQDGGFGGGALALPDSVAIVARAPHLDGARKLVDFLLSKETEAQLSRTPGAQIPLRANVSRPVAVRSIDELRVLPIDYAKLALEIAARRFELAGMFRR